MSKLARVLAVGALLTAMSLGSTAHAQDGDAPPQQAAVTPQGPAQAAEPTETTQPQPTETTQPSPPVRPIRLRVSPRAGTPGTTVKVTADLRGCTRPGSARGFFLDRLGYGVDGASRRVVREHVSGGRWYSAQYLVTKRDAVGQGKFGVVCDFNLPTATEGYASFQVQRPQWSPVSVRVNPQAGGPGTTVRFIAQIPGCDKLSVRFYDRKGLRTNRAASGLVLDHVTDRWARGHYTITSKDAVGQGRFVVVCYLGHDPVYDGWASFQVHAPGSGGGSGGGGGGSGGNGHTANRDDSRFPSRVDTGLGGTADGTNQDGPNPMLLLPAAGLMLIVLAVGLWLRQTTARGRL